MRLLTGGLIALALLSGCASATFRDTCRQRIDDCIRACPASQQARPQAHGGIIGLQDTRTECEYRCHQLCYP